MTREQFVAFLESILDGSMTVEEWNRFALGRSSDAEVESARKRLVAGALACRQCSSRPIPSGIEGLVRELRAQL